MPDGSLAQPLTQIEFSYGRDTMIDNSGVHIIAHASARHDTVVMDEPTFKATIDALTCKATTDLFINRKVNTKSK